MTARVGRALVSVLPYRDEARRRTQRVAPGAHPGCVDRGDGLVDQAVELAARALEPERADQRGLVLGRILAGAFAERRRVAFHVENVVGDLKRSADRPPIS